MKQLSGTTWIFLGIALLIVTTNLYAIITILLCLLMFLVGFVLSLNCIYNEKITNWWYSLQCSITNSSSVINSPDHFTEKYPKIEHKSERITGSHEIDEQLNSVIKYFSRDFVSTWYSSISSNQAFVNQIECSLHQILVEISTRFKMADWATYLTTRFIDQIALQIRLFREAKEYIKGPNAENTNIVEAFFVKEAAIEKDCCKDCICLDDETEKDYVSDLVEYLLFFFMPPEEFTNIALRSAVIEIVVSYIFIPVINVISSSDCMNSLIVWSCSDVPVTSEILISVIRSTSCQRQLEAMKKLVSKEISHLRSQDSLSREEGSEVKQQLSSLEYFRQMIDFQLKRIEKSTETDSIGMPSNFDVRQISRRNLFQLPLEVILKNSLALDHFLRYMDSINCQHYIYLYLNISCWKTSVSEHLCAVELEKIQMQEASFEPGTCDTSEKDENSHKLEAEMMYEQYLSEKAHPRVFIEDSLVKRLILRFRSENLQDSWFDEVEQHLFTLLKDNDVFLPSFRRSEWYIRLLAELDLLKDSKPGDEDSHSIEDGCETIYDQGSAKSFGSPIHSHNSSPCHTRTPSLTNRPFTITADITCSEIIREGNKSYAVYKIHVQRRDSIGFGEMWQVYRRYSEFYDFHQIISSKFMDLSSLHFPSKKMLNNLATWFLEKRLNELNTWLKAILEPHVIHSHPGLQEEICNFLDQKYQCQSSPNLAKKVENNLVNPIKEGVKSVGVAVKAVPESVISTANEMVDGIYKKLRSSQPKTLSKCDSQDFTQEETDENIPLRIVLQLMDEVFELRTKDQWLRRRFVLFVRHILKAMFGSIVNQKIVDYVLYVLSPQNIAEYIKMLKNFVWPSGQLVVGTERKAEDKSLTKLTAKVCLLSSIPDEFKAILGNQTTRRGVINIYECVQYQELNKRFIYTFLNGIIETVFASNKQTPANLRELISSPSRKGKKNVHKNWKNIK